MGLAVQTIFAGDVFKSNNYGEVEVIEYRTADDIIVKFKRSGSTRSTTGGQLRSGLLKDISAPKGGQCRAGTRHLTNNWGGCEVIEYKDCKNVLIKFDNCGTLKWSNSSQVSTGTACPKDITEKLVVGEYYPTKGNGDVLIVSTSGNRSTVQFSDGEQKTVANQYIREGKVYKGTWSYTQEEAIEVMERVHNNFYSYHKVNFKSVKDKMTIVCPLHGDFSMSFDNHVHGNSPSGCPKCGTAKRVAARTLDKSLFVEQANQSRPGEYQYFLEDYTTRENKIRMKCVKCGGVFKQSPEKHLAGQGCPDCSISGFKSNKVGFVYILSSGDMTKIGITNHSPSIRALDVSNSSGSKFDVLHCYEMSGTKCMEVEASILHELRKNYKQPDFKFNGYTECFLNLDPDNLKSMIENIL